MDTPEVHDHETARTDLKEEFERQADWRREKAIEYPADTRNQKAADIFNKLASTTDRVPLDVIAAYTEFVDASDSEEWNERMRQVGFASDYVDAEQFCREFIAERAGLTGR